MPMHESLSLSPLCMSVRTYVCGCVFSVCDALLLGDSNISNCLFNLSYYSTVVPKGMYLSSLAFEGNSMHVRVTREEGTSAEKVPV